MLTFLISVFKDIKLVGLLALFLVSCTLAVRVSFLKDSVHNRDIKIVEMEANMEILGNYIKEQQDASEEAIKRANDKQTIIIQKSDEIKSEYLPIVDKVKKFTKESNETECSASTRLINNTHF